MMSLYTEDTCVEHQGQHSFQNFLEFCEKKIYFSKISQIIKLHVRQVDAWKYCRW